MTPTINPSFQSLIPPLSHEELSQLEANILADGCRNAIVVWNGVLIDGHNRLAICQKHQIEYETKSVSFTDETAAKIWIIRNQFGTRNLSAYSKAELALILEPLLKAKAKENIKAGGKAGGQSKAKGSQNSAKAIEKVDTRAELAKAAHVSHDTISKVKVISEKASDEIKAALRLGETSINAEWKKLTVHVGQNSGENEWYTPVEFVEAAREVMGSIDCDPASSEIANRTVKAKVFFTKEQDGLNQKWNGSVFLNPPYAQPLISDFSEAVSEKFDLMEIEQACVLVNNATETAWFHQIAGQASAICFFASRIKFLDPEGKPGAPLQGQAMLYLGDRAEKFLERFSEFGIVCRVVH